MGIDIDWGLLRQETPLSTYLAQDQQAADVADQRRQAAAVRSALAGYDPSAPGGTVDALTRAGAFSQASALSGIAQQRQERQDALTEGGALADAGTDPAKLQAAAATAARAGDIKGYDDIQAHVQSLSAQQKAAAQLKAETIAKVAASASAIGDDDTPDSLSKRASYIHSQQAYLQAAGIDPSDIERVAMHPDSATLQGTINRAQGLGDILKGQQSDAELQLKKDTLAETKGYHSGELANGRISAGAAASNAASHALQAQTGLLSYKARKAAGGFGTPGVGVASTGSDALPGGFAPAGNADDPE